MKKKRRKAELPAELVGLLAWLEQRGVTLDNIELRTTSSAGVGLFAKRDLSAGEELVAVPIICALTAGVALASPLGAAVTAAAEKLGCAEACTAELVMWLFMCRGRAEPGTKDGCGHSWHAYLSALPPAPDPASWPEAQRAELHGSTVGGAVEEALQHVAHPVSVFGPATKVLHTRLVPLLNLLLLLERLDAALSFSILSLEESTLPTLGTTASLAPAVSVVSS